MGAQKLAYSMKDSVFGRSRSFAAVGAEPKDTIDVLVIGDSESYTSISPMDLWIRTGATSFNCGQPGQRIQETRFLLKEALKTQSPKVVLLETNVMFRDPGFIENITMSIVEPVRYYFPIFRYHNLWKMFFDGKKIAAISHIKDLKSGTKQFHMKAAASIWRRQTRQRKYRNSSITIWKISRKCAEKTMQNFSL